jgi:hypothetical protein
MKKLEFANLVKPMMVQKGPAGLYPEPRVFMEGKDLEGFNANFSFGYIKKPTVLHPVEGALVHPYDELLVFEGTDNSDMLKPIGADVSIKLGEEQEEYSFNQPTVVLVPKGTPHGPVNIKNVTRPIAHYHIGLAADYKASVFSPKANTGRTDRNMLNTSSEWSLPYPNLIPSASAVVWGTNR